MNLADITESLKDLMSVVNSAEVGLVIFDTNYTIRVWNLFMVKHSGLSSSSIMGQNLFEQFPDLSEAWFREISQKSIQQKKKFLSEWHERPYLFKYKNVRPKVKSADFMYQNVTFIPLASANGIIDNFAITISDVTDIVASSQKLDAVVSEHRQNLEKNN